MTRKNFPRLKECDGFICGQVIKKGSIPVDRIIESELQEFIKEFITSSGDIDADWLIELIKKIFQSQVDEEWLRELICSIDCESGGGELDVNPKLIKFPPEGGRQTVTVTTDASTAWRIEN